MDLDGLGIGVPILHRGAARGFRCNCRLLLAVLLGLRRLSIVVPRFHRVASWLLNAGSGSNVELRPGGDSSVHVFWNSSISSGLSEARAICFGVTEQSRSFPSGI